MGGGERTELVVGDTREEIGETFGGTGRKVWVMGGFEEGENMIAGTGKGSGFRTRVVLRSGDGITAGEGGETGLWTKGGGDWACRGMD